jgi:hypothetical protein
MGELGICRNNVRRPRDLEEWLVNGKLILKCKLYKVK